MKFNARVVYIKGLPRLGRTIKRKDGYGKEQVCGMGHTKYHLWLFQQSRKIVESLVSCVSTARSKCKETDLESNQREKMVHNNTQQEVQRT